MIKNDVLRDAILNLFPPLSESSKEEIEKNIMPQFIFYKKNGCRVDAYCTQCETLYHQDKYSRVQVIHEHGTQGTCPRCGTQVNMHCAGYGTCQASEVGKRNVVVFSS